MSLFEQGKVRLQIKQGRFGSARLSSVWGVLHSFDPVENFVLISRQK